MNHLVRMTLSTLAAAVLLAQQAPAVAFRIPAGAVSGEHKLFKGMPTQTKTDEVGFSPILLEMAKVIGRSGLPAGFFLQSEGNFADEPSIDLRSLLLFQAGLIRTPVRIMTSKRPASKPDFFPTLSVGPVLQPRKGLSVEEIKDMPNLSSTPLPRDPQSSQVVTPRANVGSPDRISISGDGDTTKIASTPMLSFDLSRVQADLNQVEPTNDAKAELQAQLPRLALSLPRTSSLPFTTRNMFRLWTFRPEGSALNKAVATDGGVNYTGTFVVATGGAIKSITGRHFTLGQGKLLANNQAGELLLRTDAATVSIEPETTAIVEVVQNGTAFATRIYALESGSGNSVTVTVASSKSDPSTKPQVIALKAGEALVVASEPLSDNDIAGLHLTNRTKIGEYVSRGNFSVDRQVERELMLKSDMLEKSTERYAALNSLRQRLQQAR